MENIFFLIIMEVLGLLFFFLGCQLWKKQKIEIMHDYHYRKVKEEDKKAYTSIMGKAMIIIAIGIMLSGVAGIITDSVKSIIPMAIAFVIGIGIMGYGQIKYNHGIF